MLAFKLKLELLILVSPRDQYSLVQLCGAGPSSKQNIETLAVFLWSESTAEAIPSREWSLNAMGLASAKLHHDHYIESSTGHCCKIKDYSGLLIQMLL